MGKKINYVAFALLVAGLSTMSFVLYNQYRLSNFILIPSYFNGISLEDMNKKEAESEIKDYLNELKNKEIKIKSGEKEILTSVEELGAKFEASNILEKIFIEQNQDLIGGTLFMFKENEHIIENTKIEFDDKKLEAFLEKNFKDLEKDASPISLKYESGLIHIEEVSKGTQINRTKLKEDIKSSIFEEGSQSVLIPTQQTSGILNEEQLESFYKKNFSKPLQEAKNAELKSIKGVLTVQDDVEGIQVDKDKLKEKIESAIATSEKQIKIPTTILPAKRTTKDLEGITKDLKDVIGSYKTTFSQNDAGRNTNIKLSADAFNGILLAPNEEFDFFGIMGNTTYAKGYKDANIYAGGKLSKGIGGGICQTSTTLYNAVLLADLEVTERYNHSLPVGYVPASRDATVSWGSKNLKFKNNTGKYIYITSEVTKTSIEFKIYGTDDGVDIELESQVLSRVNPKTEKILDSSLEPGTENVLTSGANGYSSSLTKIRKKNGKVIDEEFISKDHYGATSRRVAYNPKVTTE